MSVDGFVAHSDSIAVGADPLNCVREVGLNPRAPGVHQVRLPSQAGRKGHHCSHEQQPGSTRCSQFPVRQSEAELEIHSSVSSLSSASVRPSTRSPLDAHHHSLPIVFLTRVSEATIGVAVMATPLSPTRKLEPPRTPMADHSPIRHSHRQH